MADFFWTDEITDYIAQHGVSVEEYEEAFECMLWPEPSDSSGNPTFVAFIRGRFLRIVYDVLPNGQILPVTAYDNPEPDHD
jgi:hypothetical protein